MQPPRLRSYFTDLDGMRGILAVTVMLFHLGLNPLISAATGGLLEAGLWTLCVDYFFALSGFVLYLSLERTRPDLRSYLVKRLRRLAPVFMLGTVVLLMIGPMPSWPTLLANLAMMQSILGMPSIDGPSWSIPFELFLPALALPLLGWLSRTTERAALAMTLAVLIVVAVFTLLLALRHDIEAGRAMCGLTLGMMLGRIRQLRPPGRERPFLVLGSFAAAIAIMLLAGRFALLAGAFPLAAAVCIFFGAQTRTILSSAPFRALGRWSYSIYLLHIPVLALVGATLGSADGSVVRKIVVILGTTILAAIVYRFVERPFMQGSDVPAQTAP